MYIPKQYQESEWSKQESLIKAHPLATVVTTDEAGNLIANHFPFYLYTDDEGKKFLHAHVAKKNHQVPSLTNNDNVLVIFQSPDSYISPSYYPGKEETQKYVPTWDFACIHIKGKSRIVNDGEFVLRQLNNFTHQNESDRPKPWTVDDAPKPYTSALLKAITGLEIKIDEIECKFKLEQEKSRKDINGVIDGLSRDNKQIVSDYVKSSNFSKA